MKNWEEELQRNIESGQSMDSGPDARAYQAIFEALQKEPEYTLPPAFARQVMQKIEIREKQRLSLREWRAIALAAFLMTAALAATIYLTGVKPALGVLTKIEPYWGFIAFGAVLITFFNWIDRKFIVRKPTI